MKKLALFGILAVAGVASSANAFEFRVRFVERVGNTDVVIAGNELDVDFWQSAGFQTHMLVMQKSLDADSHG